MRTWLRRERIVFYRSWWPSARCRNSPGHGRNRQRAVRPGLPRQDWRNPEAWQHGGIEPGDRADAIAGEGKDQHAVGLGRNRPVGDAGQEDSRTKEPGDQVAALVLRRSLVWLARARPTVPCRSAHDL